MKFFFPDSLDMIDPAFDFESEAHSPFRARQQDDLYAHETLAASPYDGILVSKAVVDGVGHSTRQYTVARRHRLTRVGVNEFFRFNRVAGSERLQSMGDCGAFSYIRDSTPPYSVEEVIEFYNQCGFDFGMSVDHVIPYFRGGGRQRPSLAGGALPEWTRRQQLTLELAEKFIKLHARTGKFVPVGVAQGWDLDSYAFAVGQLQRMGYRMIALGGLAKHKTAHIRDTLERVQDVRLKETHFHLLGLLRCEDACLYRALGVVSFDTTSPLRKSFKGDEQNYYSAGRRYAAVRVPQVEGNIKLQRKIRAGTLEHDKATKLEKNCLQALRLYDRGRMPLFDVLQILRDFELLHSGHDGRLPAYEEVLSDCPWKSCPCEVCQGVGIQVVIFRGKERNTRRGFHNLFIFARLLRDELAGGVSPEPRAGV